MTGPLGESAGDPVRTAKRGRILRAALEICEREGVAATRMEQIAQRARVSKGTLYRFFESRDELLLAALLDSHEQVLRAALAGLGAAQDPRERLERLCRALAGALEALGSRARVHNQVWGVVAGTPAFEERLLHALRSLHAETQREFEDLVRAGQASGAFRSEVSPTVVADALGGLLAGFVYRASFDSRAASPAAPQRSPETSGKL